MQEQPRYGAKELWRKPLSPRAGAIRVAARSYRKPSEAVLRKNDWAWVTSRRI